MNLWEKTEWFVKCPQGSGVIILQERLSQDFRNNTNTVNFEDDNESK